MPVQTALRTAPDAPPSLLPDCDRPSDALLVEREGNGRAFRIEVRPGMSEGQYLGLALRMWGEGHWCRRDGEPHHYTLQLDAMRAAQRWLESGR